MRLASADLAKRPAKARVASWEAAMSPVRDMICAPSTKTIKGEGSRLCTESEWWGPGVAVSQASTTARPSQGADVQLLGARAKFDPTSRGVRAGLSGLSSVFLSPSLTDSGRTLTNSTLLAEQSA